MPADPRRVKDLFVVALDLTDSQARQAFLDRECGGDVALRQRLDALLAANDDPHSALNQPLAPARPDLTGAYASQSAAPAETVGAVIADKYKLLQAIGEGGMGSVFMADQLHPVKRRVAVKIIKAGMDSARVLARFEAERQALALMDHPNIAKVLDAGTTETNRPFFVMELVKGIPLTEFSDQHKLAMLDRLNLFMQICSAVQHAHQKGIIHRDLKPTNILVESHDGKPVPKVIDFGLAKATTGVPLTDQTLFTALGTVAGTPLYMAPEQAAFNAIDVDTRADIYALGVILYELLTGTTPIERATFKTAAFDEMLRLVREQEPPTPSSRLSSSETQASVAAVRGMEPKKLGRFIKGELDWIVMKALSKERDRRYETANGFAKDIERFLNHEPLAAGPPSASYRLRKFVRRNRPQVIAGTLVLLTLVGGIAGTTFGLIRAIRAEAATRQQARIAGDERDRADARFGLASDAVSTYLSKVSQDEDLNGSDFNALRRRLLESAVPFYRKLAEERRDAPRQRANQALAHNQLAVIYREMGDLTAAVREGEAACAIHADLPAEARADPTIRSESAECLSFLCQHLCALGRLDAAFEIGTQAKDTLMTLLAVGHTSATNRARLVYANCHLGVIETQRGRYQAAADQFASAIEIGETLVAEFPAHQVFRGDLASNLMNLGVAQMRRGLLADAEEQYVRAMEIHDDLAKRFPKNRNHRSGQVICRVNLVIILRDRGDFTGARVRGDEALRMSRKLVADFPTVIEYRSDLASVLNNLGIALGGLRQPDVAATYFREAIEVQSKAAEDFPSLPDFRLGLLRTHGNLGTLHYKSRQLELAQAESEAAVSIGRALVRDFPKVPEYWSLLADAHNGVAGVLMERKRYSDAGREHQAAIKILDRLVAEFPDVPAHRARLGTFWFNVGNCLLRQGKPAETVACFDEAIRNLTEALGWLKGDVDTIKRLGDAHAKRAKVLDELKRPAEADKDWARALELTAEPLRAGVRMNRACSRVRAGQIDGPLREVEELICAKATNERNGEAGSLYDAACAYGLAARPAESVTPEKREQYAKRAVELLDLAATKGYREFDHIKTDRDLVALYDRADFRALIARLEAKPNSAPPPPAVKP